MSKRLPYYQSEPAEYLTGDIMFCSYAAQGVFSIIRALYWQKDCSLTLSQVERRCKSADEFIKELIDENIIKINNENIVINFLDEQYEKAAGTSSKNRVAGKKSAELKKIRKEIKESIDFIEQNSKEDLTEFKTLFNEKSTSVEIVLKQKSTIKIIEDKVYKQKKGIGGEDILSINNKADDVKTMFDKFVVEVKEGKHQQAIEQMYMRLRIKQNTLTPLLKNFYGQLIIDNAVPKNTLELRKHFNNWLNVQDRVGKLDEYKK